MAPSLTPKDGVPVLAYPASDTASRRSCSLFIKCSEHHKKASISLRFLIDIHGFDVAQKFTLVYNADNLVPGESSLKDENHLPFEIVEEVHSRQGNPLLKILSLELKKPCPVLCPSSESILPKHGVEFPFQQLAKLARATKITVVFDYNWVQRNNQGLFQRFISNPENWNNYTIENNTTHFRQADWQVFSPPESAVSEAPPLYTDTPNICSGDCVNKRRRQAASSSPGYSPSKRLHLSLAPIQLPTEKIISPEFTYPHTPTYVPSSTYAPSPTEKDTTVGTPSPRSSHFSELGVLDFKKTVSDAIEAVLPGVLETILPDILSQIFAVPPSLPSLSPASSQIRKPKPTPTPASISSLRTLLRPQVAAYAEAQLLKVYDETLECVGDIHSTSVEDIRDIIDEQKTTITILKDECISDLNQTFVERAGEFGDETAEILRVIEEQAEKMLNDVSDRLNTSEEKTAEKLQVMEEQAEKMLNDVSDRLNTLEEKTACLRRERELLEKTRAMFKERRSKGQTAAGGQSRRAVSLPV